MNTSYVQLSACMGCFASLLLADTQEKIEQWRQEYNGFQPHNSLQKLMTDEVVAVATTVELQHT